MTISACIPKVNNSAAYQLYDDDKYDAYKLPLIDKNCKRQKYVGTNGNPQLLVTIGNAQFGNGA